jgi:ParB family chromosome partitioning protein
MAKKRNVFDINFDLDTDESFDVKPDGLSTGNQNAPEITPSKEQVPAVQYSQSTRRGPMASAITETADANSARAQAEEKIRNENDNLAHEHVRLKKLGLITDLLSTSDIKTTKLTRDRAGARDPELEELKASILAIGLSNPIRVEQIGQGYELIQGFRRLMAFREIAAETGNDQYLKIPASLVPRGEPIVDLYRKMVDENLVRKDISFGEMAQLALSYAADVGVDVSDAVSELYASARKQKRTYIRHFAKVLECTAGNIVYAEAIPRALGLDLYKMLDQDVDRAGDLVEILRANVSKTAEDELQILRTFVKSGGGGVVAKPARQTSAKTSLRLTRPEGEAKVTAIDGRIELRLNRDFSGLSKADLQLGIEAFLDTLPK